MLKLKNFIADAIGNWELDTIYYFIVLSTKSDHIGCVLYPALGNSSDFLSQNRM